jgi:hypothetical protein
MDAYESAIGIVMATFGLGVATLALGGLAHLLPADWMQATKYPWYDTLGIGALGLGLGWIGGKAAGTSAIDLLTPALSHEGRLTGLERRHVPGTHGGYDEWRLMLGDREWSIPCADAPDSFRRDVTVDRDIRLRYRRGTGLVTHLWIGGR